MSDAEPGRERRERGPGPRPGVALAFATVALAASWNGLAAPFAVVVAVVAAMLSTRAFRRRPTGAAGRRVSRIALGVSIAALGVAIVVLLRAADAVTADLTGEPVVKGRTSAELDAVLSDAASRTREERGRAAASLDKAAGGRPDGKATPAPTQRPGRPGPG